MPLNWEGYNEVIETFTFRENAAIKIPKPVREVAFSLQLDVEITSTDGNDYLNSKSNPAYGFYGYAVLVFRDHADIEIPIHQPRQRLYYGASPDAYTNWTSHFLADVAREEFKKNVVRLSSISEGVGLAPSPIYTVPPCIPFLGFEEILLREAYVKTRFGTQFKLEISYWKAVPRVGQTDCDTLPKSQKNDGDKDAGLPPDGVQPQKAANPNLPYDGFPPPSTQAQKGDYNNDKGSQLDNPNPENAEAQINGTWTIVGTYRDWQNIGEPFEYTVSAAGFAFDNPSVFEEGFQSASCPYKTFVKSSFDGRNMLDVGCSSKVLSQSSSFLPLG